MPRATTKERSRPMRRTNNGILIPDVPIMAGGNLPNAVKGVSAGAGKELDPLDIATPFFIDVHSQLHLNANENYQISDDAKRWQPIESRIIGRGRYFFRTINGGYTKINELVTKTQGETFDIGGNLNSLVQTDYADSDNPQHTMGNCFKTCNVVSAELLRISSVITLENQYVYLLAGCEFLRVAPRELPALNIPNYAYQSMFQDCPLLNSPIDIKATTAGQQAMGTMFLNCPSLTDSPIIRVQNWGGSWVCGNMFENCTQLAKITFLGTTPQSDGTVNWAKNISTSGVFVKRRGISMLSGVSGIPTGWTVEEID